MEPQHESVRWQRLANHGLFLNSRASHAARRYAFSLASVSKHFENHGARDMHELKMMEFSRFLDGEELKVYSKGAEPAFRGKHADAAMSDLILTCSFLDALCEIGVIGGQAPAVLKRDVWHAYEKDADFGSVSALSEKAMDFLELRVGRVELALPLNEVGLAESLERIFRGMEKQHDKDALTAMYGLRMLQLIFCEGYKSMDHLMYMGAARQIANYFNLEKIAQLSRLGPALDRQDEALHAIEPLMLGEFPQFLSLLRTANSYGNFISLDGGRSCLGIRLETLSGSNSMPIGSLENGVLALYLSYFMLTDDPLHAEMILRTFAPKFELKSEVREGEPYFAAFFDSTAETPKPELMVFATGERERIIEGWFARAQKKRTAAMN